MEILRCQKCGQYTLEPSHCNQQAIPPRPPRFSVEDKYADLKRKAKQEDLKKRGLI